MYGQRPCKHIISWSEKGNTYPAYFSIIQPHTPLLIAQTITDPITEELNNRLNDVVMSITMKSNNEAMHWHQCFGHLNIADVHSLAGKHATRIEIVSDNIPSADCLACIHGRIWTVWNWIPNLVSRQLSHWKSKRYSRQQNHLHVWEFWIVHSMYILIWWLKF